MNIVSSLRRIGNMVKKEFIQTLRDPHMRWLLFGPPLIQMLVFGYAATLDVTNIRLAVLDFDHTQESRELVARFSASRYFHLNEYATRPADLSAGLESGDILAAMQINSGFAQRLRNGQGLPSRSWWIVPTLTRRWWRWVTSTRLAPSSAVTTKST